ncbi:MAG TPA: GGDEF domain-containing protein [Gaiellaceae bacterium]|nr:GGDEF domain-containing protein [Gaiellaceae bacterium]
MIRPAGDQGSAGGVGSDGHSALGRLLPLLVPVVATGAAVLAASLVVLAAQTPSWASIAGFAALFVAAALAEANPVPLDRLPAGHISLAAVFFVGSAVLFGPAEAVVLAVAVRLTVDLLQRRPTIRLLYNNGAYALSAASAGAAATFVGSQTVGKLVLQVFVAAATYYVVNVVLITAAISRWADEPFFRLLRTSAYWTVVPFSIMASGTLTLAVLWDRSPALSLALVGPLLAIALYQRSAHRALVATRLALTDALTGLGNQRHFYDRLQQELDAAESAGTTLALCLLDVDGMKQVNDSLGHPVGDRLLELVASCLRRGGEAFRVGGDEFAVLLPGRSEDDALVAATSLVGRITTVEVVPGRRTRISAGLAVFPTQCAQRSELYRAADSALYASKREGESRVHVYDPDDPRLGAAA